MFKSDVYSLGMTFIYILSLIDPIIYYDYESSKIREYEIDNLLRNLSSRYSYKLIDTIR